MLGIVYLLLSTAIGFIICSFAFPQLEDYTMYSFSGKEIDLNKYLLYVPAWFVTGIIVMTWISYLCACAFSNTSLPLLYADEFTMMASVVVIIAGLFILFQRGDLRNMAEDNKVRTSEWILFAATAALFAYLFKITFFVEHDQVYVGLTVFSDFTPHVSMIRSFSYQHNFPTQYTVFAGADMKYHFMFQFLVGNLEFLGLRIDWAFNLASWLSIMSAYMLFYVLAVRISGKRLVGALSCVFLTFRSSYSLFDFLAQRPQGTSVISALKNNFEFIGSTEHEDWGLWNLNVYCNQRHLALGLAVMILMLLLFIPLLYQSFERLSEEDKPIKAFFTYCLFSREGWFVEDWCTPIVSGIILGALGFFNGAVLIATVIVLFFLAAASDRRFEYLIMAVIAGGLSLLQTKSFIDGSTFSTKYFYGFLAENRNFFGSVSFILRLLGILPIVLLAAFLIFEGVQKYLIFAFSMPLVFAFTVSLTPDIAVNHKYIMMSVMLLDIFAACFVAMLLTNKKLSMYLLSIGLVICLTATGIYETRLVIKRNNPRYSMVNNLYSPLTEWLKRNCTAEDIVLTSNYYLTNNSYGSQIIMSGVSMFNAWQYFAWSAGYDTASRDAVVRSVYGSTSEDMLTKIVEYNDIHYIVVEYNNRISDEYELNEALIASVFEEVYTEGEGDMRLSIYKTFN